MQLYLPLKSVNADPTTSLMDCLHDIKAWMDINFLTLNEGKTEVLVFDFGPSFPIDQLGPLSSNSRPFVKNLGVIFDSKFKFDKQISMVVKSSFFQLRLLARIKAYLPPSDLARVVHAFITTRLDYCNALYVGIDQAGLRRLQLVQNAAARLLTGKKKRDHITPVLAALHWLPVSFRIDFKLLLFVFKAQNGLAPPYLCELIEPYVPPRPLRSADQLLLVDPGATCRTRGDRAFAVAGPQLWNALPLHIRSAQSLGIFKSLLKTHFFSLAFNMS